MGKIELSQTVNLEKLMLERGFELADTGGGFEAYKRQLDEPHIFLLRKRMILLRLSASMKPLRWDIMTWNRTGRSR